MSESVSHLVTRVVSSGKVSLQILFVSAKCSFSSLVCLCDIVYFRMKYGGHRFLNKCNVVVNSNPMSAISKKIITYAMFYCYRHFDHNF